MKPQFTDQQDKAINTRTASIALSAGAGCGKTFVLTQRFLSELQPGQTGRDLHSIVAITFTERAAREMRDRIRAACRDRLQHCETEHVGHWLGIIRGLDAARISTIHSFCGGLLRAHAVDAGLDPRFGMLEAGTADALLRNECLRTVNELLIRRNPDCMLLVLEFGLERTRDLLRGLVSQRFQFDFDHFATIDAPTLVANWLTSWHEEYVPRILADLAESLPVQSMLTLLSDNQPAHAEMQRRCECLLNGFPQLATSSDWQMLLGELRDSAKVQGGGGKKVWSDESVYADVQQSLTAVRKSIDDALKLLRIDEQDLTTAAEISLAAMRVTKMFGERYDQAKAERGLLDFDDLLMRTRNLLRDKPSVRERAAAGIRFLMVDEFQDTDPMQADIVRFLCGAELATGKLFLVGDAKQSIYRFRRADPAVFHQLRSEIAKEGRLPLSTNFRSQPEILKFVNCVFTRTMGADYEALQPHVDQQLSPTPTIEFLFPSVDDDETEDNAEERRQLEADWMARRIACLLADTTPRIRTKNRDTGNNELRRVQPGDIVILFRGLTNVAIYEEALRQQRIEYYLVGGRAFFAQQEVFDLVNLCQFLDDPDDLISLAGVLRSPFFGLSDDALYAMVRDGDTLLNALTKPPPRDLSAEQQRQIGYAGQVLQELQNCKDRLPIAAVLNLALDRTGYDASLLNEFLGRRKLANLRKLIESAREFDQSGLFTLKDFVIRLRESIAEQTNEELAATQPESSDVVKLMSVHQSKGLEFPVVIVADMNWRERGGQSSANLHPKLGPLVTPPKLHGRTRENLGQRMRTIDERPENDAETARLFYVATTRAADYLILSSGLSANRKFSSPWMKLLAERFDLDTGLPAVDPYFGRLSMGEFTPAQIPEVLVHHARPEPGDKHKKRQPELPLADFRQAVEAAEAMPLPECLRRFEPNQGGRRQFSVSRIEEFATPAETAPAHTPAPRQHEPHTPATSSEETVNAAELGTLIHDVLERIDFANAAGFENIVRQLASERTIQNSAAAQEIAVVRISGFLASAVCTELATAKTLHRELEFLLSRSARDTPQGRYTISGKIDCLYESTSGSLHIVDYKVTGVSLDTPDTEILAAYEIQLGLYAEAILQGMGELPKTVELVLLQDTIRRIPFDCDEAKLTQLMARVDEAVGRELRVESPATYQHAAQASE